MRRLLAVLCSIAGVQAAAAQPAPALGSPEPVVAEPADAPAEARNDEGWQLYHDTFAALMQGERARARELASALLRAHPEHPATRLVRGAQLGLAPGAVDEPRDAPDRGAGGEPASRAARAELALFQTLHGIALGSEICIVADCDSAEAAVALALAGGALGAVLSLNVAELTSGRRALLNSGTAWGAINAGLLLVDSDLDAQTVGATLMAGQGLGLIAGGALFRLEPTAGQVALANSGGEWAGVLTYLAMRASGADLGPREYALSALAAIDAGIVVGGYLASRWPEVSRAQTLVIDAAGIAGVVAGGGLGVLISGDFGDRTTPALAAVGGAVGLGAAAYLTRDWNRGSTGSLHTYLVPPERGRGGVAGVRFAW